MHAAVVTADLFCSEIDAGALDQVKAVVRACAGLGDAELKSILSDLNAHVLQAASDIFLEIGATTDYAEIRAAAAMELATLTVGAEAEAESRRLHQEKKRIIDSLRRIR